MLAHHEPISGLVNQYRSLASQCLSEERHWIHARVEGGRMELDEFRADDVRTGSRSHGQSVASDLGRLVVFAYTRPMPPVARTTAEPIKATRSPSASRAVTP